MRYDLPTIEPDTRPFWDAARDRRLLIMRCNPCSEAYFYPRPFCPRCWSEDVAWEQASGEAALHTWSVVYVNDLPPFGDRVPYVAALVDLAEGPRMMTMVVDCPFDELSIGMPLRVDFEQRTDDVTVPVFRPRSSYKEFP